MATYDRQATERALIEAVGELIETKGVGALGVNAIARKAKVNKALIYRYFDNLDGLYMAFARSHTIWPSTEELLGDILERQHTLTWQEGFVELMMIYAAALRRRPRTIELLAWECVDRNALTIALETVREQRAIDMMTAISQTHWDIPAAVQPLSAMLAASVNYLLVRGRDIRVFGGVMIQEEAFWTQTLRTTLTAMVAGLSTHD